MWTTISISLVSCACTTTWAPLVTTAATTSSVAKKKSWTAQRISASDSPNVSATLTCATRSNAWASDQVCGNWDIIANSHLKDCTLGALSKNSSYLGKSLSILYVEHTYKTVWYHTHNVLENFTKTYVRRFCQVFTLLVWCHYYEKLKAIWNYLEFEAKWNYVYKF